MPNAWLLDYAKHCGPRKWRIRAIKLAISGGSRSRGADCYRLTRERCLLRTDAGPIPGQSAAAAVSVRGKARKEKADCRLMLRLWRGKTARAASWRWRASTRGFPGVEPMVVATVM